MLLWRDIRNIKIPFLKKTTVDPFSSKETSELCLYRKFWAEFDSSDQNFKKSKMRFKYVKNYKKLSN